MCLIVYLVTDHPLLIVENDPAYPDITVTIPMPEILAKVRSVVPGEHIVEVMTSEGCGCGFNMYAPELLAGLVEKADAECSADLIAEQEKRRAWVTSLHAYILTVAALTPVAVYTAWADEEEAPITKSFSVTPEFWTGDYFTFEHNDGGDRHLYHVSRGDG